MTASPPTARSLPVADSRAVRAALWDLVCRDRRAVAVLLALNLLAASAGLALPWLVGRIVDVVADGGGPEAVDGLALAVLGCAVARLLLTRFALQVAHRFAERATARLREGFVDRTLNLPAAVVERAGTGDLTTRSTTDIGTVGFTVRHALPDVFVASVQVVFVLTVLFVLHPLLGLCGVLGVPVLVAVTQWYLRRARAAYLAEGAANSRLAESLSATAEGVRTVEALGLQRRRTAEVGHRVDEVRATRTRTLALRSVLFPVTDIVHALPMALTLLVGGLLVTEGWASLGAVVAACLYTVRLADPVDTILMWVEQLQGGAASLARLKGVEQAATDAAATATAVTDTAVKDAAATAGAAPVSPPVPEGAELRVRAARYAYHGDLDVLHGVDLAVRPGERLAIVGPSGSGKSTLARLLAGLAVPRAGEVSVAGAEVSTLPPEERWRRIVLVTQEYHVFQETVRFNLAMAAPRTDEAGMRAALSAVGADWALELPEGLDTVLGGSGFAPDAAQAQQLALARVILADPDTVILDEATAMLDPTTARQTERSFAAVLSGRTVIAIAHRLHTAHDAGRVAVMENGRITELGRHDDLLARGGAYAALWRSWHGNAVDA